MVSGIRFILGSSSPRRQVLLKDLGYTFEIDPPDIDETPLKGEPPKTYVVRVASEKAQAVAVRQENAVILAADSAVAVGRHILGKPRNKDHAAKMLRLMAGRRHKTLTAVTVLGLDGQPYSCLTQTIVKMRPFLQKEIDTYVAETKNWQGYAAGYSIQTAAGGALIEWVRGSVSGVMGLPLAETTNLLRRCGVYV